MSDAHAVKETNTTTTFYPEHPKRVATDVYVRSHHSLIVVQDKPCWGCGIRHSDVVTGGKNIAPGLCLETHHFWAEDAFTGEGQGDGGIYWPRVQADHPAFDWPGSGFVLADTTTWKHFVDSEFNLQVLCSACHRASLPVRHWRAGLADLDRGGMVWLEESASVGIHHASYPVWRAMRHCRPDVPPFRVAGGAALVPVPVHVLVAADAAAVTELASTPIPGHLILAPGSQVEPTVGTGG